MNKMAGESCHLSQQVLVNASAFPVLTLKPPVSISDLSTFAEEVLGMIISHKSLHEVTRRSVEVHPDQLSSSAQNVPEFSRRQGCQPRQMPVPGYV